MDPNIADIITRDVVKQLMRDDSIDHTHISVKVAENHVFLEGQVNSYAAKVSAARDAYRVPGVRHVENNLEVRYNQESSIPGDEQITRNIVDSLRWNSRIDSSGVEVETSNGVVILKGTVTAFWEKFGTEDLAINTHGVKSVVNQLNVKPRKTVDDREIENNILEAFEESLLVDKDNIEVEVSRGEARLSGNVANFAIKREALELVNYTRGVLNVKDEITIG